MSATLDTAPDRSGRRDDLLRPRVSRERAHPDAERRRDHPGPERLHAGANRLAQFALAPMENMVGVALANYAAPQDNGHSVAFDGIAFTGGNDEVDGTPRDTLIIEAGEGEGIYMAPFDLERYALTAVRKGGATLTGSPACTVRWSAPRSTSPSYGPTPEDDRLMLTDIEEPQSGIPALDVQPPASNATGWAYRSRGPHSHGRDDP